MSDDRPVNLALRYTRLFETAQDGILLLSYPQGLIEDANPYILQLTGYTKLELVGKELWEIGLIADKNRAFEAFQAIIQSGFVRYDNIDLLTKGGQNLAVEFICNSYPVNGDVVIQCNIRDISARKAAEEALQAEQARSIARLTEIIASLSNIIAARDSYTAGHQQRVAHLASAIAVQLEMSASDIEGLRMACLVHDIGKISIPAEILTKPGLLTPLEVALLRGHVQAGFDILKPLNFPWPIAMFVLQHHERLDGSGYPNALRNEEICLQARVMAVADTVEAMASNRPYRPSRGLDAALKYVNDEGGRLFDQSVVDACAKLFQEGYNFPDLPVELYGELNRGR